jgi:uncharacterized ParB-like nuclease family protein
MAKLPASKEKFIEDYLRDPLTKDASDASIARLAGVYARSVGKIRKRVENESPAFMKGIIEAIEIEKLRLNGGTQSRASVNKDLVVEYAEAVKAGKSFPPIGVVYDGTNYWVWDGFHRVPAHVKAKKTVILAEIRQGTQRDAILLSVGANSEHGARRTNEDKRRAVLTLLKDPEWSKWSDREIARQVGVTHPFVAKLRGELTGNRYQSRARKGGDGRTTDTSNIGHSAKQEGDAKPEENGVQEPTAEASEGKALPDAPQSAANGHPATTPRTTKEPEPDRESESDRDGPEDTEGSPGSISVPFDPLEAAKVLAVHFNGRRLVLLIRHLQEAKDGQLV